MIGVRQCEVMSYFLTVDPGDGPVASDDGRVKRQLEDEGTDVGISVRIHSRNVDRVHIGSLTDLSIVRDQRRSVIVHVYEEDLQCSCAAGRRRT